MKDDRFKAMLAAIAALANDFEPKTGLPALRKALGDRSNFVVAKAANVVAQLGMDEDRDGTDIDAGCRGKAATTRVCSVVPPQSARRRPRGGGHRSVFPLADRSCTRRIGCVCRTLSGIKKNEDIRFEAVSALAQARPREALAQIEGFWSGNVPHELRLSTLASSRFRNDLRDRVATIVETSRNELLKRTFERAFALE